MLLHGLGLATENFADGPQQRSNLFGWSGVFGPLFAGLLGALSITAEVRYGTIRPTLLVNPLRRQVLVAKMWASMLIGCVFGLVAGLLVAGVGTAAMNSRDIAVQLSGGDYARIVLGSAVAAGMWGAVGVAVGAVIRSQVPALVGLVVWLLFIENLLVGDIAGVGVIGRNLPGAAGKAISGQTEQWFAIASPGWSPTTVRQTRSVLDRQLHPHLDGVLVADLTTAHIDALYAYLRQRGGVSGQPLKAGTVQRVHVVLRAALAQAMRWGWIWDNPAERAHRIVVVSREPVPPTPVELVVLLDHLRDAEPAMYSFVMLAAVTGARRAQLLGLRWRNINLQLGQVAFTNGWVEGPAGPVLAETKTKRRHTVELDETTTEVLTGYRNSRGSSVDPDGFVFATDEGVTWNPNWVTKAFRRHLAAAGLRPFRLHDLRHFMATEMLQAGVPIPVVSRRLDHRRISTTLDFYAHVTPAGDRFAADVLQSVLYSRADK